MPLLTCTNTAKDQFLRRQLLHAAGVSKHVAGPVLGVTLRDENYIVLECGGELESLQEFLLSSIHAKPNKFVCLVWHSDV